MFQKSDKPKIKKLKSQNSNSSTKAPKTPKATNIAFVFLSLLLTAGLFVGLIFLQNYLSEEITYKTVIVAKSDIPENTIFTKENATKYLTFKQINILDAPSGTLISADSILGKKNIVPIIEGEYIFDKDFEDLKVYTEYIENPIEVSLDVSAVSYSYGGKLRGGDLINIIVSTSSNPNDKANTNETVINEEKEEENKQIETQKSFGGYSSYLLKNVYVSKALDASGKEISSTDVLNNANILILIIDKKDELKLTNALFNTKIYLSKVMDKDSVREELELSNDETNDSLLNNEEVVLPNINDVDIDDIDIDKIME